MIIRRKAATMNSAFAYQIAHIACFHHKNKSITEKLFGAKANEKVCFALIQTS